MSYTLKKTHLILAFFLFTTVSVCVSAQHKKPNIILILADDLGYSDLGCMGSEIHTPNLDRLANQGILYTEMHNTAKCTTTRASLLNGIYSQQTNLRTYDNTVNIGEILQSNDYLTLWSGKHHAAFNPITRGFDRFYGLVGGCTNYFNPGFKAAPNGKKPAYTIYHEKYKWVQDDENIVDMLVPEDTNYYTTDVFTDKAIGWLEEYKASEKPVFLYMAYNAPHFPLQAKKSDIQKYKGKYAQGYDAIRQKRYKRQLELGVIQQETSALSIPQYDKAWKELSSDEKALEEQRMEIFAAMVDCLDQNIGRLLDKLEALNMLENSLIFFMSDNGSSSERFDKQKVLPTNQAKGTMGEVDTYEFLGKSWAVVGNTPLRYWKKDSYAGGIRTPMIVYNGANTHNEKIINHQAFHLIDVMPTIISQSNSKITDQHKDYIHSLAGVDLSPSFKGETVEREEPIYFQFKNGKAIIDQNLKLVKDGDAPWELFDLNVDKSEVNDLAQMKSKKYKELQNKWNSWYATHNKK